MRPLLTLVAALSLAACAGEQRGWEKPGATAETAGADMLDCRRSAAQQAYYQSNYSYRYGGFGRFGPTPFFGYGRRGGSFFWYQQQAEFDRFNQEQRLAAFCMRNKGYELVTVPPPDAATPGAVRAPTPAPKDN